MKEDNPDQCSLDLYAALMREHPDECKRCFVNESHWGADWAPEYLGFVEIYKHLADIIAPHWRVVDLGCAAAPQAYYFKKHENYIGVDVESTPRFTFENTEHWTMDIDEAVKRYRGQNLKRVFAICSAVPDNTSMLRQTFPNLFVWYPSPVSLSFPGRISLTNEKKRRIL